MEALGGRARQLAAAIEGFVLEPPAVSNGSRPASPDEEAVGTPTLILASSVGGAGGGAALAAAVGVAAATAEHRPGAVLLADLDPPQRPRRPTMLASEPARELEEALRRVGPPYAGAAARGHLCHLALSADEGLERLGELLESGLPADRVLAHVSEEIWPTAVDRDLGASGGLLQAELPADRALVALAVRELHERGMRCRVAGRPLGRVASRRALAGMDPGGAAGRRAARLARGLLASPR